MSKRLRFFLTHFTISLFVALIIFYLVFFIWYPSPLDKAVGVNSIVLMVVLIDVVIGPMLTWIVYKEGKKTLRQDLTVIIFIQFGALLYGIYNIAEARPVWIAFNATRFELIRKIDVVQSKNAKLEYEKHFWGKPQIIAVNRGSTIEEKNNSMFKEFETGVSAAQRPETYMKILYAQATIKNEMRTLDSLVEFNPQKNVDTVLSKDPLVKGWLPLRATNEDMVVLLNKDGEVVKIVDLRPWK